MVAERKGKKSPAAPYISLREAVEICENVFNAEGRATFALERLPQIMRVKKTSSGFIRKVNSLEMYSLINEVREGMFELSNNIINYLDPDVDDKKKFESIKKSLISPSIYREVIKEYGEDVLPTRPSLEFLLLRKGFSKIGAPLTAKNYIESYEFLKLVQSRIKSPYIDEKQETTDTIVARTELADPEREIPKGEKSKVFELPLVGGEGTVRIEFKGNYDKAGIDFVISVLELYKRELAEEKADAVAPAEGQ